MANVMFPAMRGYVQSERVKKKQGDKWCISKFDVCVKTGYSKKEDKAEYSYFTIKMWKDIDLRKGDVVFLIGVTPKQESWEKDGKKHSRVVFFAEEALVFQKEKTQEQKVKKVFQDDIPF